MELVGAVNLLQLIFLALRLDEFISWKWQLVFLPLWIVYGIAIMIVVYSILVAAVFSRSLTVTADQRRASSQTAIGLTALAIPSLTSLCFLTKKLDGELDSLPFSILFIPFGFSVIIMALKALHKNDGNMWWFGMQKPFCLFILDAFPKIRLLISNEYGNISHQSELDSTLSAEEPDFSPNHNFQKKKKVTGTM